MKRGFTFIELIMVIAVVAVLALVIVPRMLDIGEAALETAIRKVAADMKYARDFAVNHRCGSRVDFEPLTHSYTVYEDSSGSWDIAQDPTTGEDFTVILNEGQYKGVIIVSVDFDGNDLIEFNSAGEPFTSGGRLTGLGTVEMGYEGGTVSRHINVAPVTGRINVPD
jgi:prepilin-type N-terminal cleavage/methylation domain-containing protein